MFQAGERIFLPGTSGEPTGILRQLFASPGAHVITSFVKGVNALPLEADRAARVTGLFGCPGTGSDCLPISYGGFANLLAAGKYIDTAIVQVSEPDPQGRVSFGPAVEFGLLAIATAKRRIAVVNPQVGFSRMAPSRSLAEFDVVVTAAADIPTFGSGSPDPTSVLIARNVAKLIGDGAALQMGLGKVPAALVGMLSDRKGLKIHTGMLSDGIEGLVAARALDPSWRHLTTTFLGSRALYDWATDQDEIEVAGCETTHDPRLLAAIDGFIAINSALEIDLFGQANLERADGRQVSGCGGAPDFSRAAKLSAGGLSIIALPSRIGASGPSRIRCTLDQSAMATIPRHDIDAVVTENGIAFLSGLSVMQRAESLIAIAAPGFQPALQDEWLEVAKRLA